MEKTRIDLIDPLYKNHKSKKVYIYGGAFFFLVGVVMLTLNIMSGEFGFTLGTANPILYILMSLGYLVQAFQFNKVKNSRYIEFSDSKIQYQLGPKLPVTKIKTKDIEDINIELLTITITHKKGESELEMNDLSYQNIQTVKSKFMEMKLLLAPAEAEAETA